MDNSDGVRLVRPGVVRLGVGPGRFAADFVEVADFLIAEDAGFVVADAAADFFAGAAFFGAGAAVFFAGAALLGDDAFAGVRLCAAGVTVLFAAVVVGGFIGWAIDRWLGTSPGALIVFLALGTAAGFWNVYRIAMQPGGPGGTTKR